MKRNNEKSIIYNKYTQDLKEIMHYESYKEYRAKTDDVTIDFVKNYSLISTNLEYAADASGWYWKFGSTYGDINKLADSKTVKEVTKAVQGGNRALEKRKNAYELLTKIFK